MVTLTPVTEDQIPKTNRFSRLYCKADATPPDPQITARSMAEVNYNFGENRIHTRAKK